MSRATWYRHGKPTEKPEPPSDMLKQRTIARRERVSIRTVQRIERIMRTDLDLFQAVLAGAGKWGQAEQIVKRPDIHRKWRESCGLPWPIRRNSL